MFNRAVYLILLKMARRTPMLYTVTRQPAQEALPFHMYFRRGPATVLQFVYLYNGKKSCYEAKSMGLILLYAYFYTDSQ